MSNQVINSKKVKKGFYDDYPSNWDEIREKTLERFNFKCSKCDRKDKLAVAHIDQNTQNNSDENLIIFCPKHHIEHDQPYHVFSMMASKNRKTDNSFLGEKIKLRCQVIQDINKNEINVLECFAGDGVLWDEVKKSFPNKKINVLKIDKKGEKTGVYLKGDNVKFIGLFEFDHYDVIDLDAYGTPINQLEVVFMRRYKGVVLYTFIQTSIGALNHKMLETIGYKKTMITKCPTLFNKNGFDKFCQYLAVNGIKKVVNYSRDRKNYGFFYAA